jgi:nucleoside phosphorylase
MIHLICALPCEARPLIDCHDLRHVPRADLFQCYVRRDGGMSLTISGPGKTHAAAAVSYTHTLFNSLPSDAWLNIGIAGHRSLDIATAVLAHRIEDVGSGQCWYPQRVFKSPCPTLNLRTLDRPSTDYDEDVMDMEAAGFYSMASRCGIADLIHVLKIISDNAAQPAGMLDARFFTGLIENGLTCINNVIVSLQSLSAELVAVQQPSPLFNDCLERWHFTEYERNVLQRLLQRWHLLCPDRHPLTDNTQLRKGKDLILYLEKELGRVVISFAE